LGHSNCPACLISCCVVSVQPLDVLWTWSKLAFGWKDHNSESSNSGKKKKKKYIIISVLSLQVMNTVVPKYVPKLHTDFTTIFFVLKHIPQQFNKMLLVSIMYWISQTVFERIQTHTDPMNLSHIMSNSVLFSNCFITIMLVLIYLSYPEHTTMQVLVINE
jgi:hypothetical protein